ncbi:MAG: GNAT family N-acetyltransferase, partial [bacterium]
MELDVRRVPLEAILSLRALYRQEMACQIVHDSYHERGITDSYLVSVDGEIAGYGSTKAADGKVRDCVKEFYVLPDRRFLADRLFQSLLNATNSIRVESQTNDRLLTLMLFDHCRDVGSDTVLFEDGFTATHSPAGVIYREGTPADKHRIFDHTVEPVGDWLLEFGGEIVATGGILCHYNPPYGDIFMEVAPSHRRRGFG